MFLLMFILLIPICAFVIDIFGSLGWLDDMTDPLEWDNEETENE